MWPTNANKQVLALLAIVQISEIILSISFMFLGRVIKHTPTPSSSVQAQKGETKTRQD